jgi:hypothetical protein
MNVTITTSTTALTSITVFAGTAGDREWWTQQAAQNCTAWSGILDGARDLLAVAVGEDSSMDDTFARACCEADRKAAARSADAKTLRARRLLADDDLSYERAYGEIAARSAGAGGHGRGAGLRATARCE